jgi:hypothetical protein
MRVTYYALGKGFFLLRHIFFIQVYFAICSKHLAECYGEEVLQCLGERPSVGPLHRQ